MEVRVGTVRHVVVDDNVDTLDINTTAENVGGNHDTLVEVLEVLVPRDTVQNGCDCPQFQSL